MDDFCWIHNEHFNKDKQCSECSKIEKECKLALDNEIDKPESKGTSIGNLTIILLLLNVVLWSVILFSKLLIR